MLWSPYDGPGDMWSKAGRYAVALIGGEATGMQWERSAFPDMSETISPSTIPVAQKRTADFLAAHPSTQLLVENYFFEANTTSYPEDSPWWFRDEKGKKVQFWAKCYNMATDNPDYVSHIAKRIDAAANATGGKAGVYIDNLRWDAKSRTGWNLLLGKVRESRPNHFIMANAGWDSDDLAWIAPKINGLMYEDSVHHTADKNEEKFYARVARFDSMMKKPTQSVVEIFGKREDKEMPWRELIRTLVYTDAAYLYSDSTYGHQHVWRPEWSENLGAALEVHRTPSQRVVVRKFEQGTVAWNPTKSPYTLRVHGRDVRTGKTGATHVIPAGHGLFLKTR